MDIGHLKQQLHDLRQQLDQRHLLPRPCGVSPARVDDLERQLHALLAALPHPHRPPPPTPHETPLLPPCC